MDEGLLVLVADDDPDQLAVVATLLGSHGFRVLTAATGREALALAREERPALVLLDLMMESHDTGFSVAKDLRSDERTRAIPVVIMSAVREKTGFVFDQARDGHWMRTDDFLEKPVQAEALLARLRSLLGVRP